MIDLVSTFCKKPDEIVSFLIPFVEGYTIVSNVIPIDKEGVIVMMVKLISMVEK